MSSSSASFVDTHAGRLPAHVTSAPLAEIIPYPNARLPEPASAEPRAVRERPGMEALRRFGATVLPTMLMLIVLLGVWQISCGEGSGFPSPSRVWTESHDVIVHPLKGVSIDGSGLHISSSNGEVGIAGQIITSLKRVAIGYGLSSIVGIAL